ncbi:MAG: response regulator [Vulcanimicrobiota bacterium]
MSARILLLEDDADLRAVLEEVLRDEGYEVVAVSNGADAVAHASRGKFELIIADIRMEGMDGLEAVEKTQQLNPDIGSLIVSGYATEEETSRARNLEVGGYLKKPFKMQELLGYVRKQLGHLEAASKDLEEEQIYLKSFEWALRTAAQAFDETRSAEGSLVKASELAQRLCKFLEAAPAAIDSAPSVAIVYGLRQSTNIEVPGFILPPNSAYPTLSTMLSRILEPDEEDPIEIKAIRHAVQSVFLCETPSEALDPRLKDAIAAVQTSPEAARSTGTSPAAGLRNSLVTLAKTLEDVGDLANAEKAYKNLCSSALTPRERTEGFLGMARVYSQAGHSEKARKFALTALKEAKGQGPFALSSTGLEAALLLDRLKAAEAEKALNLVKKSVLELDLETESSLIALALGSYGAGQGPTPEDYEELLSPPAFQVLDKHRRWLLGHLFQRATDQRLEEPRFLSRMVTDFPKDFEQQFAILTAEGRLTVAHLLENSKHLPDNLVSLLAADAEAAVKEIGLKLKSRMGNADFVPLLRLYSFGAFEMAGQDGPLADSEWRTRKVKYLLALLATDWGKSFPEEQIMETFWPKDVTRTKKNLYWATTTLRNILKNLLPNFEEPLVRDTIGLKLHPQLHRWHDLNEFEKAISSARDLEQAESGDGKAIRRYRRTAARLYRGAYLEGCFFEFAAQYRTRTEEAAVDNFVKAAELAMAFEDMAEALEHTRLGLEIAPYRQDAHALKMRAHIRLGQNAQALDQYETARIFLDREYNLEPSTELIELYHRARLGFGA